MERKITIKGRTGLFDVPSFSLSENEELKIVFEFPEEIRFGRYRVVTVHGTAPKKTFVLSSDKHIELSADWLNEGGTENIEFSLELLNANGTVVIKNDYCIEPLIVSRADGDFTFSAAVQRLQDSIECLEKALAEEKAVKETILKKLEDFADNGAELFPEELK